MENAFRLHLEDGKGEVRIFDFDQNEVVVGRDPASGLVIDDVEISRMHLVITRKKDGFFVDDRNSTNGTFMDGKQIKKKTEFKHGDQLVLGQNYTLRLEVLQPVELVEEPAVPETVDEFEQDAAVEKLPTEPVLGSAKEPALEPAIEPSRDEPSSPEAAPQALQQEEAVLPEPKMKTKPAGKERPKWVIILLAALVFIVVFCVIPLVVIEATNQWCDLFAGFFNSFSPGVCP